MKKIYLIRNVSCQSCVSTIEKFLLSLEGVSNARVNITTEELFIEFDEKIISVETIKKNLEMLGYPIEEKNSSRTITFLVSGLHCQGCASTVEKIIKNLNGVDSISVNLATEKATLTYHPSSIKLSEIFNKIKEFGYNGEVITEDIIDKKEKEKQIELKQDLNRLLIELFFGIIILYISMGSMIGLPIPKFIHYDNSPLSFALLQFFVSIPIIYLGRNFYLSGIKKLIMRAPNMDSLIALGTGAAFLYSFFSTLKIYEGYSNYVHNLYYESGVIIIVLISLGKYLEKVSKGKTSESIKKLMNLQSKKANLVRDKKIVSVDIDEIVIGDTLLIKPGESIPTDGTIIEGSSSIDESMLTGESMPVTKIIGSNVFGATINGTGSLKIKVTSTGENTTLYKIIKLVENAQSSKAPIARMADVISGYFVYTVISIAILASLFWYIAATLNIVHLNVEPNVFALKIFISVLIIACPCSLGLATPTAIMVGTGRGAELGILIKSGETLEKTCKIDTVIFDKTGTITIGKPSITDIFTENIDENALLKIAASLEQHSEHPLGTSILNEAKKRNIELFSITNFKSETGFGISGNIDSIGDILIGNKKFMDKNSIDVKNSFNLNQGKTIIYIATNKKYLGLIAMADKVREDSKEVIKNLKKIGIDVIMLTGDNQETALSIAKEVGIDKVIANVSPEEKYLHVKKIQTNGKNVAMVGDGINDSPALTQAEIGIAIGGGSDIALESADIVLMSKNIKDVPKAIELSKATVKNIKQNLFWAFVYNGLGIPIAAGILYPFGGLLLNPMLAGLAMAMSSVSVVLNALRLKHFK